MKTKVVHCRQAGYDIYIGRPSLWGNPFKISNLITRRGAVEIFEAWLRGQLSDLDDELRGLEPKRIAILERMHELKGKTLGCWCSPKQCHGHVYARWLDNGIQLDLIQLP